MVTQNQGTVSSPLHQMCLQIFRLAGKHLWDIPQWERMFEQMKAMTAPGGRFHGDPYAHTARIFCYEWAGLDFDRRRKASNAAIKAARQPQPVLLAA